MTTVGKLLNQDAVSRAVTIALLSKEQRKTLAEDAAIGARRELKRALAMNDLALDLLEEVA